MSVQKRRLAQISTPPKLGDMVYEALEEAIMSGKLRPGEKLFEDEIADQLGVSTTPVREAISRLEREGLVIRCYHRSPVVRVFSEKDVIELYDVREGLEELTVRLACRNLDEAGIEELERTQVAGEECLRAGDLACYGKRCNEAFHALLLKAAQNERLSAIMRTIRAQVNYLIATTMRIPGTPQKSIAEHRKIIDALRRKDSPEAEALMRAHIRRAKEDMLRYLQERSPDGAGGST